MQLCCIACPERLPWQAVDGRLRRGAPQNPDTRTSGSNGIVFTSRLPQAFGTQCGADQAARIDAKVGAAVRKANVALLNYERTLEGIRNCGILRDAKAGEIAAALTAK